MTLLFEELKIKFFEKYFHIACLCKGNKDVLSSSQSIVGMI